MWHFSGHPVILHDHSKADQLSNKGITCSKLGVWVTYVELVHTVGKCRFIILWSRTTEPNLTPFRATHDTCTGTIGQLILCQFLYKKKSGLELIL